MKWLNKILLLCEGNVPMISAQLAQNLQTAKEYYTQRRKFAFSEGHFKMLFHTSTQSQLNQPMKALHLLGLFNELQI